jgi:integrase
MLTTAHVSGLVDDLHARGLAPATIKRIIATLQAALSSAVRSGHVSANPVRGVRLPQGPGRVHTVWNSQQCAIFLAACPQGGLGSLFHLALVTGMRRGELMGLSWSDVDLEAACLVVRTTRVPIGGRVVTGTPKSRCGVRRIYLDAQTVAMLRAWKMTHERSFRASADLVFTHPDGAAFTPWWVSRSFDKFIASLPLPRIRFHDLRHTSATIGLASGESLKEVSARLGHADIAITANVYTEILPQTAQASATRRASMLAGNRVVLKDIAS